MVNKGSGIVVLVIIVIVLFYFAVVGHIELSYYASFSLSERIVFGLIGIVIVALFLFFRSDE